MNASNGMCESDVVLVEQELNSIKLAVLDLIRTEIVSNVEPRRHFTYLRSKNVLDERDCDEIKAIPSRAASAEKFLDVLAKKGAKGYDEFCKALMYDQTQTFLLTKLSKMLEILRAKVLENKRQKKFLQATAAADEKLRLREQQQSYAVRQPQKQPRQHQYHHHEQLPTSPPVSNGHHNSFPLVTQQQPQQPLIHHHGYPTNFAATGHSSVPNSSSPVPGHSTIPSSNTMLPGYTHHHHPGLLTLPANLSLHASRQYQATMMGQDTLRQDFRHSSRANHEPLPLMSHRTYNGIQPRGWSTEPLIMPEPQPLVAWDSQSQPCGQPLLTCRGQDET